MARERFIERKPLAHGLQIIESIRGENSHQHNPFFALILKDASEKYGEVYEFSLVYNGNFAILIKVDKFNNIRVSIGINHFDLRGY